MTNQILPSEIKDNKGKALCPVILKKAWIDSHQLQRKIDGNDLLSLDGESVKIVFNEASKMLTKLSEEIKNPSIVSNAQRLDRVRTKVRWFYAWCRQVYVIRKSQRTPEEVIDQLHRSAKKWGWSDSLLHLRITQELDSLIA